MNNTFRISSQTHALLRSHLFKLQIPSAPLHIPHHICCSIPSQRLIHTNYARRRRSVVTTAMASSANVVSPELPSLELNDGTFIPLVSPCTRPSIPANYKSDWLWQLVFINHRIWSWSLELITFVAGTAWFKPAGTSDIDRNTVEAVKTAIKLGFYHLDGAEIYNTEPEVGIAIKESGIARDKLFVTTKVMHNTNDISGAIDASLKKLQLDFVDL